MANNNRIPKFIYSKAANLFSDKPPASLHQVHRLTGLSKPTCRKIRDGEITEAYFRSK